MVYVPLPTDRKLVEASERYEHATGEIILECVELVLGKYQEELKKRFGNRVESPA